MDLLAVIILGFAQGITEWLPVSSKTVVEFIFIQFFNGNIADILPILLYVHLGTVLAAILYFRSELSDLFLHSKNIKSINDMKRSELSFYISSLIGTAVIGIPLLLIHKFLLTEIEANLLFVIMGIGLLLTAFMLHSQKKKVLTKFRSEASISDGFFVGIFQGLSALPGLSRSGTTTTALVWKKYNPKATFELSFILSIPTVLIAEIFLYSLDSIFGGSALSFSLVDGFLLALVSFFFGYLTIDALIHFAKNTNLSFLAAGFGIMMIIAGLSEPLLII